MEHDQTSGHEAHKDAGVLNRRIDLTAIPAETIAWLVVATVAIGIRLIGRTNWPLSPDESAIARDAWALDQGIDLSSGADAHPAIVQLTAFLFFLFGDTDYVARLVPLIAGIGILVTLYWLRSWFGSIPALSIAVVWALSPVMTMSTMRLDGGMLLVLSSLLALLLTMTMHVDPDRRKGIILGVALAVGLTAHPLAWIVLPLTILPTMLLIRDFRLGGQLTVMLGAFLISLLVITSWLATRLSAVGMFFTESLSSLWSVHLSGFGEEWRPSLVVLLIDEPLTLTLSGIGLAVILTRADWNPSVHPAIYISCLAWAIPLLTAGILLGGSGPALYAVSIFPLVVVAGLGLAMLLDGLRARGWRSGHPALWGSVFLGLLIAIVRFADSLAQGPQGDLSGWIIGAAAIGILILVPLGYAIIRLSAGTGWTLLPAGLMVLVLIVAGLSLRTTLMLPDTGQDRPGEVLLAGGTSPAIGRIEHRIRTYSRDITAMRDVRDPAGVHGLMIVIESELANPTAWYFRNFPNLLIVDGAGDLPEATAADVVFAPVDNTALWNSALEQHHSRQYSVRFAGPDAISSSTYHSLLLSAVNPLDYRNLFTFGVHRQTPELLDQEYMTMYLRDDHAAAIWGTSGR